MQIKGNPGALAGATGAEKPIQSTADGPERVARKGHRKEAGLPYFITPDRGAPFRIVVSGRVRWALDQLREAGEEGCTPITNPAPRWSAYVHDLRGLGVEIETIHEAHGGEFSGTHGRYVLRCRAVPAWTGGAA